MSLPSPTATKRRRASQRGQLSPFMFGLIMGMSVFSALSLKWAQQELAAARLRQAETQKQNAQDLASALEFATLTETPETYSDDYNIQRARQYASRAIGQTRGGQEYLVVARDTEESRVGKTSQVVAITGSDDTLRRSEVYRTLDPAKLQQIAGEKQTLDPVVTFDTGAVRTRQVTKSQRNMEAMGEQIYAFYAAHLRMPTGSEYQELAGKLPIRDAWGAPFRYSQVSEERGRLEFTTPWGYTQPLNLTLK